MDNASDVEMDEEQDENGDESPLPIVQRNSSSSGNDSYSGASGSGSGPYDSEDGAGSDDSVYEEHDENTPIPPVVSRAEPVDIPTNTRLKIRVNKLHMTAEWKWIQGGDDSCGICRMPFEACCVDCAMPGDGCPLVLGVCRHPFHVHCIGKWTEAQNTAKPQCPLCRQEWKFQA